MCEAHYYIATESKCSLCNDSIVNCISCNSNVSRNFASDFLPYCSECQNNFDVNSDKTGC